MIYLTIRTLNGDRKVAVPNDQRAVGHVNAYWMEGLIKQEERERCMREIDRQSFEQRTKGYK